MNPEKLQQRLDQTNRALEKSSSLISQLRSGEYKGNPNYDLTNASGIEITKRATKAGLTVEALTEKTLPFLSKLQKELEIKADQLKEIQRLQEKGYISAELAKKAIENLFPIKTQEAPVQTPHVVEKEEPVSPVILIEQERGRDRLLSKYPRENRKTSRRTISVTLIPLPDGQIVESSTYQGNQDQKALALDILIEHFGKGGIDHITLVQKLWGAYDQEKDRRTRSILDKLNIKVLPKGCWKVTTHGGKWQLSYLVPVQNKAEGIDEVEAIEKVEEISFSKEEIASLAVLVLRTKEKTIVSTSGKKNWGTFHVDDEMLAKCNVLKDKAFPFSDYSDAGQRKACEQLRRASLEKLKHILESGENSSMLLDGIDSEIRDDAEYFVTWLFLKNDLEKGEHRTLIPYILGICPETEVKIIEGYVAGGKTRIVIPDEFFPKEIETKKEEIRVEEAQPEEVQPKPVDLIAGTEVKPVSKREKISPTQQISNIIQICLNKMISKNAINLDVMGGNVVTQIFGMTFSQLEKVENKRYISHKTLSSDHHEVYTPLEALQVAVIHRLMALSLSSRSNIDTALSLINEAIRSYQEQNQRGK